METTEQPDTTSVGHDGIRWRRRTCPLTTEATPPSLPPFDPEPIEWTPLGDDFEGFEQGVLEVPIDYANPDDGSFELFLVRRLASDPSNRIGSMLVNPGGPGFGGTSLALSADLLWSEDLNDRFDIVGWDPRGTGLSEPFIDCIDDYDQYFGTTDITPDDDAERQQNIDLARDFAERCVENNEDIIQFVGTNNSARDIDSIRRALGEDEITYYGLSYGSELGGTWTTLFPDTVRAAVLDGAADPNADELGRGLQQIAGFEATLTTFLDQCSNNPECAFHNDGDAEGAFDQLMLKIDEKPLPADPDRPPVTRSVALQGVVEAMYSDFLWPELEEALAAAAQGDGTRFARLERFVPRTAARRHVGQLAGGVSDDPLHGLRRALRRSRKRMPRASSSTRSPHACLQERWATTCARSSRRRTIHASRSPAPEPGRSSCAGPPATQPRRCRALATWPKRSKMDA